MHPCLWCIRPPRATDGPIATRTWRRLALASSALLALTLLAMLETRSRAREAAGLQGPPASTEAAGRGMRMDPVP